MEKESSKLQMKVGELGASPGHYLTSRQCSKNKGNLHRKLNSPSDTQSSPAKSFSALKRKWPAIGFDRNSKKNQKGQ